MIKHALPAHVRIKSDSMHESNLKTWTQYMKLESSEWYRDFILKLGLSYSSSQQEEVFGCDGALLLAKAMKQVWHVQVSLIGRICGLGNEYSL